MAAVQLFDAVSYRIGRKVVCWKCLTRHQRFQPDRGPTVCVQHGRLSDRLVCL